MKPPDRAIFSLWPQLADRVPWLELGELPTPLEPLERVEAALGLPTGAGFIKRDDLTSPLYGGNKVRTLEVLLGEAQSKGAARIVATGAFGSNHAVATLLHAQRIGLEAGALLFPQPPSQAALDNLLATLSATAHATALPHWSALPLGLAAARLRGAPGGGRVSVMVPGGATPLGALGYVSAGIELARQVERGLAPPEAGEIIVGVGSTCTSAGLLVGLHHAARAGVGWRRPPRLIAVRVTPWPITSAARIARLAEATSRHLALLAGDPRLAIGYGALRAGLEVDRGFIGAGYGEATPSGLEAVEVFQSAMGLALDTTYSGKSAAALIARLRRRTPGPLIFWSTRSTAPLPLPTEADLDRAPRLMRWWIERARRALAPR